MKGRSSSPQSDDYMPDEHYSSLSEHETTYFWHISRQNWVVSLLDRFVEKDSKRMSVLDFGCGTGGFLHAMAQRVGFARRVGVDASAQAVDLARRYGDFYIVIDPENYTPEGTYDIIFLMDVLEHIKDDVGALEKLLGALKPDGRIVLSVPAHRSLFSGWDEQLGHIRRYGKRDLREVVGRAGGRVLYDTYAFSYLFLIALMRPKGGGDYENKCEFPPVSEFLSHVLHGLNWLEIRLSRYIPILFGTSAFCVIAKRSS